MYLAKFEVRGLFGRYDHVVDFPEPDQETPRPLVRIIHGPNGVGKTRVLSMIDGLMRLDFNPFREVPFEYACLRFSTDQAVSVAPFELGEARTPLIVEFGDYSARLDPSVPGPLEDEDSADVERFKKAFFAATDTIDFEFIETSRLLDWLGEGGDERLRPEVIMTPEGEVRRYYYRSHTLNPKARHPRRGRSLSDKVRRFITEAQVRFGTYFASSEPDLFERILKLLTKPAKEPLEPDQLLERIEKVYCDNLESARFGLEVDQFNYEYLMDFLKGAEGVQGREYALTALGAYVEMLEVRSAERASVGGRLKTFERLVNDFLQGKYAEVNAKDGLTIRTSGGEPLEERALSSGEYHLLYLMVTALVTRRRGTVIAIDEPEMSLHIAWQRKLIRAICECAAGAEPQFLFATHSPDIVSNFREYMIHFDGAVE